MKYKILKTRTPIIVARSFTCIRCFHNWRRTISLFVLTVFLNSIISPVFADILTNEDDVKANNIVNEQENHENSEEKIIASQEDQQLLENADVVSLSYGTIRESQENNEISQTSATPVVNNNKQDLREKLLVAKKRYLPYVDLTDQIYSLADLLDGDIFTEFKTTGLFFLYLKTDKVNLNKNFATQIHELAKTGIKEILIFFLQDQLTIDTAQFNHFMEENNIYINLIMAPITSQDMEKKDLLKSMNGTSNDEITYNDDSVIKLLNNKTTEDIISHNYAKHIRGSNTDRFLVLEAPKYIISSSNSTDEIRAAKSFDGVNKNTGAKAGISKNIRINNNKKNNLNQDVNQEKQQDKEQEEDNDLDKEQMDNKFNRADARSAAAARARKFFYEGDIVDDQNVDSMIKELRNWRESTLIDRIFDSASDMEYITSKALDIVVQNYAFFGSGININNLPIGLAYKNHILFASYKRPKSMPVNEFTVHLDCTKSYISNPMIWSFLPFATQASVSLDAIYGSKRAGKISHYDRHPIISDIYDRIDDTMLDKPYNSRYATYDNSWNYPAYYQPSTVKDFFVKKSYEQPKYLHKFPDIYFYDLSESDIKRLDDIYTNLEARGLEKIFSKIIKAEFASRDGGFLLDDKTYVFLKKLFQEILPLADAEKQQFFIKVLTDFSFKNPHYLEDIFEGVDGIYKKLKEFMQINEVDIATQDEILNKSILVIRRQIQNCSSFKIGLERFAYLLGLLVVNGGSIREQLAYLDSEAGSSILKNPKLCWRAKELGLTIVHSSLELEANDLKRTYGNIGPVSKLEATELVANKNYTNHPDTTDYAQLTNTLRYAATIVPHQRPSMETYANYLNYNNMSGHIRHYQNPHHPYNRSNKESLKTRQYFLFNDVYENTKQQLWFTSSNYDTNKNNYLQDASKIPTKHYCYSILGIEANDCNLVTNFTTSQAAENWKLLSLNVLSSTGEHYDNDYPDQEFEQYISLFNVLFSDIKVYDDIYAGSGNYIIKDYIGSTPRYSSSTVDSEYHEVNKNPEIISKEQQHEKIVDTFINLYKNHPVFNFAQVVSIGLVDVLDHDSINDTVINQATILAEKYDKYFTKMLRVLISTTAATNNSKCYINAGELRARSKTIAKTISNLFEPVINDQGKELPAHELLTQKGKYPENLALFASAFAQEQKVEARQINDFFLQTMDADNDLKQQLFDSFATTKLPYANGKIVYNYFPKIDFSDPYYPSVIKDSINLAKPYQIPASDKTKFNDANLNAVEQSSVYFTQLKARYGLKLPEKVEAKRFADIRKYILEDKDFVKNNFINYNFKEVPDKEIVKNIHFDVAATIFAVFADKNHNQETNWVKENTDTATFLFDKERTLEDQYLNIEYNYKLLNKCIDKHDHKQKAELLESLLKEPNIPYHQQNELLLYLNSIDRVALQAKKYTIPMLVKSAGNKIIAQHFDVFKNIAQMFIKTDIGIELEELYRLVESLVDAGYSNNNIQRITEYCLETTKFKHHPDYIIMPILAKINGKSHGINELVNFMISISPDKISLLREILGDNLQTLLTIKEIKKIKAVMKIALKLTMSISKEQYSFLIKQIRCHDADYTSLVSSYLLADIDHILSKAERIKIVFNNFEHIEKAHVIFSGYNTNRFMYNKEKLNERIKQTLSKNTDSNHGAQLSRAKQHKLCELFAVIMQQAQTYKTLNINEIRNKAIALKHQRMLLDKHKQQEIEQLDAAYIALIIEALYRCTGKFPYDTQILSVVLGVIVNQEHIIEELVPAEGKSIITALQAAYLCFTGQTVDVTTSSLELAVRDRQEFTDFYQSIGLEVADAVIEATSEAGIYKKGGINYAVASDLALFRANREFYSNTHVVELNTDVSLIADEVDFVLTSGVNFKLAAPLIDATQEETRVLFNYIKEFAETDIFKNKKITRKDDVKNLKLYLYSQFQTYNSAYTYPLRSFEIEDLKNSKLPLASKLYNLHFVLTKGDKCIDLLFDELLSAVLVAERLTQGKDYIITPDDLKNLASPINAIPIIKDQPSRGTVFGEGVQSFLHLLIEQKQPELKGRFDISIPFSTIFNISPKNFFDYYRLSGGRIIGLTGTAGDTYEAEEFRKTNKMLAFSIPRYDKDRRIITEREVDNKSKEEQLVMEILSTKSDSRPVVIFAESPLAAERIYKELQRPNMQLYALSQQDTAANSNEILNNAGKDNVITVTTPLLGRGTDFKTNHKDGFLGISLCTDITDSGLKQIQGRVGRGGWLGEFISIYDKELFGDNMAAHKLRMLNAEKSEREKYQPLTDVLAFFNRINQDNIEAAISTYNRIANIWRDIVDKDFSQALADGKKSYLELRDVLVERAKNEYPASLNFIDDYLAAVDAGAPDPKKYTHDVQNGESNLYPNSAIDYVNQKYIGSSKYGLRDLYSWSIDRTARTIPIANIEMPGMANSKDGKLYCSLYKAQSLVINTHTFGLEDNKFVWPGEYEYQFSSTIPNDNSTMSPNKIALYLKDDNKLYIKRKDRDSIEIPASHACGEEGISQDIYKQIVNKLQHYKQQPVTFSQQEQSALNEYANSKKYNTVILNGEGSIGSLMVSELKSAFNAYKVFVNSNKVNKLANIINNFENAENIDVKKLKPGKYQAIRITTKIGSGFHAETILTDGSLLFWINRGARAADSTSGVKIFKITKDMKYVKDVITWMKTTRPQNEVRDKIYSLLREDNDKDMPAHVMVAMPDQTIGNCTWAQAEGLIKVVALISQLKDEGIILQDNIHKSIPGEIYGKVKAFIESQKWQKVLKNANDIYQDFIKYDKIVRLEAIVVNMDEKFPVRFISSAGQQKIIARKAVSCSSNTDVLLASLTKEMQLGRFEFAGTIYEEQVNKLLDRIDFERALSFKTTTMQSLNCPNGMKNATDKLNLYKNIPTSFGRYMVDFLNDDIRVGDQNYS